MTMRQKTGILLLVIGMLCGVYAAILRSQYESHYKTVELIWDGDEAMDLAYLEGQSLNEVYEAFKRAGGTAISITEATIPKLIKGGTITLEVDGTYKFSRSVPDWFDHGRVKWISSDTFRLDLTDESLDRIGLGFPSHRAREIRNAGLSVVPRPLNHPGLSENDIVRKFEALQNQFPESLLIFDQDQVLGAGGWTARVGKEIRDGQFTFGFVEFAEQFGDSALKAASHPRVVRVHSIPLEELDEMPLLKALRRYIRSVRERNVRALYVHAHPWANPRTSLLPTNLQMVSTLSRELKSAGFTLGTAHPMGEFQIPPALKWCALLGLMGGAILLPVSLPWMISLIAILSLLGLMGIGGGRVESLRYLALIGAIIIPLSIFEIAIFRPETRRGMISGAIGRAAIVLALSLGGALMIATLLSQTSFLGGQHQFMGVKFAFAVPLLIILGRTFRLYNLNQFRSVLAQTLTIGTLVGIGLLAIGFLVYILRTGNFVLPMFPLEEGVREGLEKTLGVRPRFREFAIGYPSLIILELGATALGSIFPWLLSAAILIPISVVNTFAHLHIPIEVSVLRTLYGFLLGTVFGTVSFFIWKIARKS